MIYRVIIERQYPNGVWRCMTFTLYAPSKTEAEKRIVNWCTRKKWVVQCPEATPLRRCRKMKQGSKRKELYN